MSTFFSKLIIPSMAFAGMAGAFLAAAEPAAARTMNRCQIKHSQCSERCIMNANTEGKGNACIQRTCNHQYPGCDAASMGYKGGRRGFVADVKQPGSVASGPQSPRAPGNTGPFNPGTQGPFGKTGPFVPGGMKPTGGVVSGGMPKNGGIVPSGPVRMSSQGKR